MRGSNFEYGALTRGIYTAMLWSVWVFVFVAPSYLVYYVPLLIFLGIGLKPLLIKTGFFSVYQNYLAKLDEKTNQKLLKGYRTRNTNKLEQLEKNREEMRKSLLSKKK